MSHSGREFKVGGSFIAKATAKDDVQVYLRVSAKFKRAFYRSSLKTKIRTQWRLKNCHINSLEQEAALLGVWHMSRSSKTRAMRVPVLGEST